MAGDASGIPELDQDKYDADEEVKIICLGGSAVGKSKGLTKLFILFLNLFSSHPLQLSTYALTLYKYTTTIDSRAVLVADMKVTQRNFNFAKKQGLPLYFVSAADGTNVVKMFKESIKMAMSYKQNSSDFMDEVMQELESVCLDVDTLPSHYGHIIFTLYWHCVYES
uniref:RAB, member of RAS oncogene family-like 2 n=1 Tax=Oncorhynchus kisutch TaxID=8019 RepID=A0A8C7HZA7_ONCKI